MRALALLFALTLAQGAAALELALPSNARQTAERVSVADSYAAPLGPFVDEWVPSMRVEGEVRRAAWRIASPGLTPLQVLAPLRDQVALAGYDIALDCDARACGGFDFRFAVEVLPAPSMYVNIRSYRFLTGLKGAPDAPEAAVTLLVSTSATAAYVQVVTAGAALPETQIAPTASIATSVQPAVRQDAAPPPALADTLLTDGHIVLAGLEFATGGAALGEGPFPAISALAAFLQDNPDLIIALVGHTDSVGSLEGNITLSRARARAVRDRLIERYQIAGSRLQAEGMGYLAPVASNLDPDGREANRRVEAVVLSPR
ncbi:MAG: OmpA family protein [Pseudomonadota bacterium]